MGEFFRSGCEAWEQGCDMAPGRVTGLYKIESWTSIRHMDTHTSGEPRGITRRIACLMYRDATDRFGRSGKKRPRRGEQPTPYHALSSPHREGAARAQSFLDLE